MYQTDEEKQANLQRIAAEQAAEEERLASFEPHGPYPALTCIARMKPGQNHVQAKCERVATRYVSKLKTRVTEAVFSDHSGAIKAVWFGPPPTLATGTEYDINGKLIYKNMDLQLSAPKVGPVAVLRNVWTGLIDGGVGLTEDGKWGQLRKKVFERDGYKCVLCGSRTDLTADHIVELSLGGANQLKNLRTLCAECHQERHGRKFLDGRSFDADDDYGENYELNPKVASLLKAQKTRQRIGIKYIDNDRIYSERVIHPKSVYRHKYLKHIHVYVSAYDELDSAERVFRLSRIKLCNTRLNFYDNNGTKSTERPKPYRDFSGFYRD
jgi:5-methylcytosine-specific restriction endonuclease McrA